MWGAAIGASGAAAGSVLNSVGQQQGFRSLAKEKRRQRGETNLINTEDVQDMGATIQNSNPLMAQDRLQIQMSQPGQQYLESVRNLAPVGLSVSQQVAGAPQAQGNMAALQAGNQRLADTAAKEEAQTGLRLSQAEFKDRRGGREAKARRLAALYDILDMQALQKGEGLRNLGNMITAGRSMAGGMA